VTVPGGFTVVLIDSSEPAEGDFVHVESFDSFEALCATQDDLTGSWQSRLIEAARELEERDGERSYIYRGIE